MGVVVMLKLWKNKHKQNAQDMAWLVRAAFETGFRSARAYDEWRDAWRESKPRATLVSMGYVKEGDDWR